jgi:hypothetical protein
MIDGLDTWICGDESAGFGTSEEDAADEHDRITDPAVTVDVIPRPRWASSGPGPGRQFYRIVVRANGRLWELETAGSPARVRDLVARLKEAISWSEVRQMLDAVTL